MTTTNATNCPNESFLSEPSRITLLCLHSLCCIIAIVGNGLVLVAIARTHALRQVSMYFLASLSAADFLVGFIMNILYIIDLAVYNLQDEELPDRFYVIFMKIENFFWIQTITATTFSLCAVSVDRFVAVTSPLRYQEIVTENRCFVTLAFIWSFSCVFATTRFFIENFESRRYLWLACSIVTVGIPLLILIYCYFNIAKATRRQVRSIRENSVSPREANHHRESVSNRKTAITVIIVGGMFFLLFFPVVVVFAMLLVVQDICTDLILNVAWLWVAMLSFYHSAFNPWVYFYRNRQVRNSFKQILCGA